MALTNVLCRSASSVAVRKTCRRLFSSDVGVEKNFKSNLDLLVKEFRLQLQSLRQEIESLRNIKNNNKNQFNYSSLGVSSKVQSEAESSCNKEPEKSALSHKYPVLRAIESVCEELAERTKTPEDFPFKIEQYDATGYNMSLKARNKTEIINVEVHCPPGLDLIVMMVDVRHWCLGWKIVEFDCLVSPTEISISKVRDRKGNTFSFSEIDGNLQEEFTKYLETIGIKPTTAKFLIQYMNKNNTPQKKYIEFHENIRNFFKS